MRIWLKDADRRPDPAPVKTDDRKAVLVGTGAWVVALVALLVVMPTAEGDNRWWLLTCAIGVGLGLLGLIYTHHRQR
ncbi:hypothetical protein ABIB15_000399 [Marisediminicola sp. UYEF4]|uniref:DUF2530 domain-containing protein n=1 Tax=Marisediminicola sp. UYEF4 TaxID=1756384 RepID=UPI0033980288